MIDVTLQPIGRSLLAMSLAAFKTQAVVQARNEQQLKSSYSELIKNDQQTQEFRDISQSITSSLIDKRFNKPTFKKSATTEQKKLQSLTKKQYLQSRNKYLTSVSSHNKKVLDMKMKSSFKTLKNIL